jgi:hypothetical protein
MPAKNWKPVRLTETTLHACARVRQILLRSHEMGKRQLRFGTKGEVSNDEVILTCLLHFLEHNRRSRKPKGTAQNLSIDTTTPNQT